MRTFVAGKTKIDVIAQISREDLELDRLVLSRFEGSATIANAAFQTLVDRYSGRPLADYALAPREINYEHRFSRERKPSASSNVLDEGSGTDSRRVQIPWPRW
jgi:hypothetical protein